MSVLLDGASVDGFGPVVAVTSSFATVRVSGIPTDSEKKPTQRVQLHWSEDGVIFEPLVDTMQWSRSYPVDLPAGSGTVKAKALGLSPTDSISATITFG